MNGTGYMGVMRVYGGRRVQASIEFDLEAMLQRASHLGANEMSSLQRLGKGDDHWIWSLLYGCH
jgi:hypothetical protein